VIRFETQVERLVGTLEMAIYQCDCGLVISTPDRTVQCVRCRRVLGPRDRVALSPPRGRIDDGAGTPDCHIQLAHNYVPEVLSQLPGTGCR